MKGKLSLLLAAGCLFAILMSGAGYAQTDPRVAKSMEALKAKAEKLGAPKVEGKEAVGGKDAPALYFGTTKINNNFDVVEAIGKEDGQGMTATLFVKGGDEFIRVSTSVPKPDGSGRAIVENHQLRCRLSGLRLSPGWTYLGIWLPQLLREARQRLRGAKDHRPRSRAYGRADRLVQGHHWLR